MLANGLQHSRIKGRYTSASQADQMDMKKQGSHLSQELGLEVNPSSAMLGESAQNGLTTK